MSQKRSTLSGVLLFIFITTLISIGLADELTRRVDNIFSTWDSSTSPGLALGIFKNGKVIYERGYGMANLDYSIGISPQSVFYVASVSKQFTAACIALLIERHKISLDDDIRKYLPELPDYGKPVRVRDLVFHMSGIRDYSTLWELAGENIANVHTVDDVLGLIARQKELNFSPGEEYNYSNSGYFLLAIIVKRVSGKSLREFAEENIFRPLGMKKTHFHDDSRMIVKDRAICYSRDNSSGSKISYLGNWDLVGDGGLLTTGEDLFLWDQNFYNNNLGKGDQSLINLITTPGAFNNGKKGDYAFGLRVTTYRGLRVIRHAGSLMGFRSEIIRFPDKKFTVIVLANLADINPYALARQVADFCLEKDFERAEPVRPAAGMKVGTINLSTEEMREKTGFFDHPSVGDVRIFLGEKGLTLQGMGGSYGLSPLSRTRFVALNSFPDISVEFFEKTKDKPREISLDVLGMGSFVLRSFQPVIPAPSELEACVGTYYSGELDATYKIEIRNKELSIRVGKNPALLLTASFRDRYVAMEGWATLDFFRDRSGKIQGFYLRAERIKNIKCIKK